MNLSEEQKQYIKSRGLSLADLENQINLFKQGTRYLNLNRPADINDGIIQFDDKEVDTFDKHYLQLIQSKKVAKFVPASGAATRMFKDLYSFLENKKVSDFVVQFIEHISQFAFYRDLQTVLEQNGKDINQLISENDYTTIIEYFLLEKGLNYGSLPKGLLNFHIEKDKILTPIDEHIKETIAYAGEQALLSFTISEQFEKQFKQAIESALLLHNKSDITYNLSYQKSETDTVAVDTDFNIVELDKQKVLLRPGGHGSLIENLNDIDADIIFIKNIDNVCADSYFSTTVKYKRMLASVLVNIQEKIFKYSKSLENYDGTDVDFNRELKLFFKEELNIASGRIEKKPIEQQIQFYKDKLNRPIRVCGMVKNEGEPGGGPFWVEDKEGTVSLQIVESSQIDMTDNTQEKIFKNASYFNPVDLVCSVKDKQGKKYDLKQFVDKEAYFIANKSFQGKEILALEHPGLWNGGMGNWNTIFVEVSSQTFNPVKTVNDLLRTAHQN